VTCRSDLFNDVSLEACVFTNFVNKILINTFNLQAIMEVIAFDLQITSN
jgi:hypothetical protein